MFGRLARPACVHCRNLWLHTSSGAVQAFRYATSTEATTVHGGASADVSLRITLPNARRGPRTPSNSQTDRSLTNQLTILHRTKQASKGRRLRRLAEAHRHPESQMDPDWTLSTISTDAPIKTALYRRRRATRPLAYRPIRIGLVGAPHKTGGRLVLRSIRRQGPRHVPNRPHTATISIADIKPVESFLDHARLLQFSAILDGSLPADVTQQLRRMLTISLSVTSLVAADGRELPSKRRDATRRAIYTGHCLRTYANAKSDKERQITLDTFESTIMKTTSRVGSASVHAYADVKDAANNMTQDEIIALHIQKGQPLYAEWYDQAQAFRSKNAVVSDGTATDLQAKTDLDNLQAVGRDDLSRTSMDQKAENAQPHEHKFTITAGDEVPDEARSKTEEVGPDATAVEKSSTIQSKTFTISAKEISVTPLHATRGGNIPDLSHGLKQTLMHPGIHWLQDPKTRTYNFDGRIQKPLSRDQFDFKQLPGFVRPSQDTELRRLLKESGRKFAGSTSSLSSALSHVYFALNGKKPLNTHTRSFVDAPNKFAPGAQNPASIVLNYTKDGTYLIDSDKDIPSELRSASVLSEMGHVFEKLLTYSYKEFQRFRKDAPDPFKPEESREKREAYHYSATPSLVMRSQLDCQDARLPKKTFDIKTRATIAIRRDQLNFEKASGYQISTARGYLGSFEREKYDLIRSAFLKYSMQARIGNMDGIFIAYHSITRMFGFEYLPLSAIDVCISGSHEESEQAFRICVAVLEKILHQAIADLPERTLRISFSSSTASNSLSVVVAPAQGSGRMLSYEIGIKSRLNGQDVDPKKFVDFASTEVVQVESTADAPVSNATSQDSPIVWEVDCRMVIHDDMHRARSLLEAIRKKQSKFNKKVTLPEGLTDEEVEVVTKQGWTIKDAMDLKSKNPKAFINFFPVEGVTYTNKTYGVVNVTRRMAALGRKALRRHRYKQPSKLASPAPVAKKSASEAGRK